MTDSCDILVLGGGPAGSASATMLSDAGYKVVILEREKFPREHVGESLLPASIPILEQIGVMPEIERAGFVTKHGATLVWGADPEPWSWYFADDPGQRPTSFQVVRSEFDDILLKNASKHGVEVIEEAQVLDVIFENERATGAVYLHEGSEKQVSARFIVDASGQAALLSRKLGLLEWDTHFNNLAVYGYFKNARHLDSPNDGNIFIEAFEHGWLWKIPLHIGMDSVGAVVDKDVAHERLRELGSDGFLLKQIEDAPHVSELLENAELVGESKVVRDWSYKSTQFSGDGYILVGDAACFVDPLFSSGVHLALGSASLASTYVQTVLKDPSSRSQADQTYRDIYEKQYQYFHLTAQLFYGTNRTADSYFWEARRILGDDSKTPKEAFVKVVGGQPPQGYERAVIERGEVPDGILNDVKRMESYLEERKNTTERLTQDGGKELLESIPSLPSHIRLVQKPILSGQEYKQVSHLVVDGQDTLTHGYPLTAVMADLISRIDGGTILSDIIGQFESDHGVADKGAMNAVVLKTLPELITIGMIDVTAPGATRAERRRFERQLQKK
ncbi:MAG: tryptophan 7-halogenase [Dehalococcoidia bacterium]|nr:tryptophan 7-halogenase [Dehalococcoidia bacterium]|tara:strand:- start:304 stop:1983 length:1680 start_codon:yes stop_codon:yes gene_type:complete